MLLMTLQRMVVWARLEGSATRVTLARPPPARNPKGCYWRPVAPAEHAFVQQGSPVARRIQARPTDHYHSTEIAAVVMPAPTEQRISLSLGLRSFCISSIAKGMLALEVLPTRSMFR